MRPPSPRLAAARTASAAAIWLVISPLRAAIIGVSGMPSAMPGGSFKQPLPPGPLHSVYGNGDGPGISPHAGGVQHGIFTGANGSFRMALPLPTGTAGHASSSYPPHTLTTLSAPAVASVPSSGRRHRAKRKATPSLHTTREAMPLLRAKGGEFLTDVDQHSQGFHDFLADDPLNQHKIDAILADYDVLAPDEYVHAPTTGMLVPDSTVSADNLLPPVNYLRSRIEAAVSLYSSVRNYERHVFEKIAAYMTRSKMLLTEARALLQSSSTALTDLETQMERPVSDAQALELRRAYIEEEARARKHYARYTRYKAWRENMRAYLDSVL